MLKHPTNFNFIAGFDKQLQCNNFRCIVVLLLYTFLKMIRNTQYLKMITKNEIPVLDLPLNNNIVYYSVFNQVYTKNAFRNFSIKYAINGEEFYKIDNATYRVHDNLFLLAAQHPSGNGFFDSPNDVMGICIDICPISMAEAYTILSEKEEYDFDNYLSGYFTHLNFFDHMCNLNYSLIGDDLRHLAESLTDEVNDVSFLNKEWFLALAEKIILQEYGMYKALNGISSVKPSTRKETLRRLCVGKDFMDDNFLNNPGVGEIADRASMSEFHFFRSFRQAYSITPYQYMLKRRLEFSKALMAKNDQKLSDIAASCGFPDLFTFSKAFKRQYGLSPSKISKYEIQS